MQALEKIGVLEKDEEKGGRRITQSGQRDLGKSYICIRLLLCITCDLSVWSCFRGPHDDFILFPMKLKANSL
jgi:hypothetical protein